MKNISIITLLLISMQGCNNGYTLNTTNVDTANMKKYPAGMVINGYTLPPEPNKTLNEKTLLGVDSNGDGIRDDLERYIIILESKNKYYPKTWTATGLQLMKAYQDFMKNPTAKTRLKTIDRARECEGNVLPSIAPKSLQGVEWGKWKKTRKPSRPFTPNTIVFNTKERKKIEQIQYDTWSEILVGTYPPKPLCDKNLKLLGEI